MKIAVLGTGYVGLVTGVCLSEYGHQVACIDNNAAKVARLQAGDPVIFEPNLAPMMQQNSADGRLHFTTETSKAVKDCEVVFLAIGTPPHPETGEADLQYLFAATEEIAPHLSNKTVVVTKSTVPVGTNYLLGELLRKHCPAKNISIASNPEFLREGSAVHDFMRPSRVLVGVENEQSAEVLKRLYHPLTQQKTPLIITAIETAEMAKYAANAFLATKVAFINEMADICEQTGADIRDIALTMGLDDRIGAKFLNPGPGIGGSCFPKDTRALQHTAQQLGIPFRILDSVIEANNRRKIQMVAKVISALPDNHQPQSTKLGILGVTFKQNTDDIRESPALAIIEPLLEKGYHCRIYDPKGMEAAKRHFAKWEPQITWCESSEQTASQANALVILTEWNEFRSLNYHAIKQVMASALLIDLRNVCDPHVVAEAGFDYCCIGKQ